MNVIHLQPDGRLAAGRRAVEDDPLIYLGWRVALAGGVTLRSFCRLLERYPLLQRLDAFIPDFLRRCRLGADDGCRIEGIEGLEIFRTIEMIGYPGAPRLEIFTGLRALAAGGEADTALRALHPEQVLDTPLSLGRLKHVVFGDQVDVFEFDTTFNLFEFIETVIWEFSFHAGPKECALRR